MRTRWLVIPGLLAAGQAAAADSGVSTGVPLAIIVLSLALAAGAVLWARRRLREERALREAVKAEHAATEAALAAAPSALWRRRGDGSEEFRSGSLPLFAALSAARFSDILARFPGEHGLSLQRAIERLDREGVEFALSLEALGGGALDIAGRRVGNERIVWFTDAGGRRGAEAERDRLRHDLFATEEAVKALPIPVWRRRADDLRLLSCNAAYAAAVDATPERATSEGRELLSGAAAGRGRQLAERARDSGTLAAERHHVVIGGARHFLEIGEIPLGDGTLLGFARDLTDAEAARGELQRHTAAHAEVLEAVGTAIAIYGADTRLKFHNTAFNTLWRLEEDFLASEPTLDEVLERLRERRRLPEYADFRAFRRSQAAMFTSLMQPQEELLHLPDDRTLRMVVAPHPLGGLTFLYEDVTDRLALERSYNTLIEVQRETLDNLYEGIAVFGSDGRLKLFNPAYAQMWNLVPEDLQGEPHVSEIVDKARDFFDDGGDWASLRSRIITRVTAWAATEGTLERQDQSVLRVASVPLPDGNVLLSYLDVTDLTTVERALLEKNEALETAGRLKSEFIANVSYELRTPLNAIIGFAEILTNQYFGELNARQLDYSRGILDSSQRLLSLINDILDLATIEAGYMTLETEAVDIHSLMASVLGLTRERARKQNLNLDFDCPPDLGSIIADERRLKQALFNLISNAIKFTPTGGTITLRARRAEGEVALTVADTGIGIPREHQQRVFEKFERGNPQARASGAGLGLSLVKSFIELHGGRVEIDSQPGHGTRVTCYLSAAGVGRFAVRAVR